MNRDQRAFSHRSSVEKYLTDTATARILQTSISDCTRGPPVSPRPPASSRDDHRDGGGVDAPGPPAASRSGGRGGLGRGCGGAGEHGAPARGAGVVRDEPGVDAADVELVAAPGQHAHLVAVGELAQADGAHVRRARGPAGRAVHLDGEAPQRALLLAAAHPSAAAAAAALHRRSLLVDAAFAGRRRAPRPPDDAPRERVEPEREEQGEEKGREDDHHVGVEARVAAPAGAAAAAAQRALRLAAAAAPRWRGRARRAAHVPAHGPGVRAHTCLQLLLPPRDDETLSRSLDRA